MHPVIAAAAAWAGDDAVCSARGGFRPAADHALVADSRRLAVAVRPLLFPGDAPGNECAHAGAVHRRDAARGRSDRAGRRITGIVAAAQPQADAGMDHGGRCGARGGQLDGSDPAALADADSGCGYADMGIRTDTAHRCVLCGSDSDRGAFRTPGKGRRAAAECRTAGADCCLCGCRMALLRGKLHGGGTFSPAG